MAQARRIVWLNVVTVLSARILDGAFVLCGISIMAQFIRNAHRIEPFTARN